MRCHQKGLIFPPFNGMLFLLKIAYFLEDNMLKRMLATFVLLCLLPVFAVAQDGGAVVDLVNCPDAEWAF